MKNKYPKQIITKSVFIVIMLMFASIAFAQHDSRWNAPIAAVNMKNPFPADASSLERGKNSYQSNCVRCHGKEGVGDGTKAERLDKKVTDLSTEVIRNHTDGELYWKISQGRKPMPLKDLTNDQRWDIVNYIRTFKKK